jgi:uncharacterized membrane protein YhaH (DUF805 family)
MSERHQPYWFHAKRYGWGWGLPARWEGWVVFITWLIIVGAASPVIAVRSMALFYVFILLMSAVLIAVCYAKGEPPRWRWGK